MTTPQTLSEAQVELARALYEEFWSLYPTQKNPTDINTPQKASFLVMKGFENIRLMQRARKQRYDFTRHESGDDGASDDSEG